MKIAFVGKGGSGKSSMSWLAVKTLESEGKKVLAIDADHNMDLTSNLGLDYEKIPLMYASDLVFAEKMNIDPEQAWSKIITDTSKKLPGFTFAPKDEYTNQITTKVTDSIDLINVGLGDPQVLHYGKCSHGLSGPLKYYLGLLDEGEGTVVIDSVAGADMINFGLYSGIDVVVTVVESHRNSVKVFEQIKDLCEKTSIPIYAILNKPQKNEFYDHVKNNYADYVLGEIPADINIGAYLYESLSKETKNSMREVLNKVLAFKSRGNLLTMRSFHAIKTKN